ncbi:MAG: Methionine--tRNA ligase [Paucimonas sp.]|nr:Methionine--tRNA ligase [Paucimonas sp.]
MRALITITPPTPNGDLHLGHLAGPFLAADVFKRTLEQKGWDTLLVSYSDDYQSYMLRRGRQLGTEPFALARKNALAIQESMQAASIAIDHFLQAQGNPNFLAAVAHYYALVEKTGGIASQDDIVHYCKACDLHGYEAFGRGLCNYCGHPSDASQCEFCARAPVAEKMQVMRCVMCGQAMAPRKTMRQGWQLGRHYARLRECYAATTGIRADLRTWLDEVLRNPDDRWGLTRPGERAIPNARAPGHEVHTWFAGLAGYRAAASEVLARTGRGELQEWWNDDTLLVHFLGFDCAYSHAVAYRALLELEDCAPRRVHLYTNRFLTLDGEDFSTSRNHAVWVREMIAGHETDAVRLFLAANSPEQERADFSRGQFKQWYQERWRPLRASSAWAQQVADREQAAPVVEAIVAEAAATWRRHASPSSFSMRGMAQAVMSLMDRLAGSPPAARSAHAWAGLSVMAQALCPALARDIRLALEQRAPASLGAARAAILGDRA